MSEDRPRAQTVDYLLTGSAIARARWELDYVRGWQRNPWFYLDQTLASLFVSLTPPSPFNEARSAEIVGRVQTIPKILADGEANLKDPAGTAGPAIHPSTAGHWSSSGRNGARAQAQSHARNRLPAGSSGPGRDPCVGRISGMVAAALARYVQQGGSRTRELRFLPQACCAGPLHTRTISRQRPPGMGTSGCLRGLRKEPEFPAAAIGPGQRSGDTDRHREKTGTGNPRFSGSEKYTHPPRLGTALSQPSLSRLSRAAGRFRGRRRSHRARAPEGKRHQLHQDAVA